MRFISAGALFAVLGIAIGGAGAPGTGPGPESAYAAEYEQAMEAAGPGFQHSVLSDFLVTEQEYGEAQELLVDCLAASGIRADVSPGGGYSTGIDYTAAQKQADLACNAETVMFIEPLYQQGRVNPSNADFSEVVASCIVEQGLAPESFGGSAFQELYEVALRSSEGGVSGLKLPGGKSFDDAAVKDCFRDPQHSRNSGA